MSRRARPGSGGGATAGASPAVARSARRCDACAAKLAFELRRLDQVVHVVIAGANDVRRLARAPTSELARLDARADHFASRVARRRPRPPRLALATLARLEEFDSKLERRDAQVELLRAQLTAHGEMQTKAEEAAAASEARTAE